MSEQTTFRYLNEEQQESLLFCLYQALTASGHAVTEVQRIAPALCQRFHLLELGHIRPEQLEEARTWIVSEWVFDELEGRMKTAYQSAVETVRDVRKAYITILRDRLMISSQVRRGVAIAALVLVCFLSAAIARPVNLQAQTTPTGAIDLTDARTVTTTLTEEETQAWLSEFPAAAQYAMLIMKVEKTTFLDYSAENVVATLATGDALISARMNDSKGIKLFSSGQFQNLATQSPTTIPLGSFSPLPSGIEDDCFWCLSNCDGHARNVRGADENIAVAAMGVAGVGCGIIAITNPPAGFVCAAAALTKFYADLNSAKQKYIQAIWQCGMTCKRPNGTSCRGRDR